MIGQRPRKSAAWGIEFLVTAFFLLTPFTWSFLGIVGGFLVRPIDLVALAILGRTLLAGRLIVPRDAVVRVLLFFGLVTWLLFNSIVTGDVGGMVSAAKITLYVAVTLAITSSIVKQDFSISHRHATILLSLLFAFFVTIRPEFLLLLKDFGTLAAEYPNRAIFLFWHSIFNFNLFGAQQELEANGVSFRNTAALGFLVIGLFSYSVLSHSMTRTALLYSSLALVFFCVSRTGIISATLFIVLVLVSSRQVRDYLLAAGLVLAVVAVLMNSVVINRIEERFGSDFGGREEMVAAGLTMIVEAPLLGMGSDATVASRSGERTVHNVVVALGAQYGIPALVFSGGIILFNVFSFFHFLRWALLAKNEHTKRLYVSCATAAFVIATRPNVSASAENFYSYAEWACFALILAGYAGRLRLRRPAETATQALYSTTVALSDQDVGGDTIARGSGFLRW